MNEKPNIVINIFGGNGQIAPVATSIVLNFYGNQGDEVANQPEVTEEMKHKESVVEAEKGDDAEEMTDEEFHLSVYVPDKEALKAYIALVGECTTAYELASVVVEMLADEKCGKINKNTVVKAVFIKSLLPFAGRLISGNTVNNIRTQINNMLAH